MNDVFETFVFKLFYEFYFFPVKEQQSSVSWITERERQSINIITDILIFEKDRKTVRTIIDTKYKEELTDSDRYQLSHYAHDYEKSEVYAILPKFDGAVADSFRGAKQDIQIKIRHIEIDKILDWIYSKENHSKEIREYIEKLVPLESDLR